MSYLRDAWCCVCTTRLDKVKKGSIRRINPDNINEYSTTFPNSLILLNDCVCGDCKTNFYKIKTLQKQNENENKSNHLLLKRQTIIPFKVHQMSKIIIQIKQILVKVKNPFNQLKMFQTVSLKQMIFTTILCKKH